MTSDTLDAAIYYIERRWPVLPVHSLDEDGRCTCAKWDCTEPAKHPMLSDSRHKDAFRSVEAVRDFYLVHPYANVSIVTGVRSGVVVLDVDEKKGGFSSLRALEATHGTLPLTLRSHTGGGGMHLFFRNPKKELRGRIGMRPGLDVRAEDMNCIMPPSKHKSGFRYRWDQETEQNRILADLPQWLETMIRTKNKPQKKVKWFLGWR